MTILLFGIAKDIVGASLLRIEETEKKPKTVQELKQFITAKHPEFKTLSSMAIAVNSNYAGDEAVLKASDEIAVIPPVSGG